MGLIDSIKSGVARVKDAAAEVVHKAEVAVTPAKPAPTGYSSHSSMEPRPGSVGGKPSLSPVETPVASRADRDKPMNLYGTSQHERLTNLPRLTQIDGDQNTDQDRSTCGVQCVVASMYLKNPAQLPKVASYLLGKGDKLDQWAKDCHLDPKKARADLEAIKNGTASPRQLAVMSELLKCDVQERAADARSKMTGLQKSFNGTPEANSQGINDQALQILTKDILAKDCGVEPGPIRMSLRNVEGNGHWVAQVDVASMADIEENAKVDTVVTFDPWPNAKGRAGTGVALSKPGADNQQRGTKVQDVTVRADGTVDGIAK